MKLPFSLKSKTEPTQQKISPFFNQKQRLTYRISRHPLLAVSTLLIAMVMFGTAGYMVIEGWNLLDALYMTTITISTIGFGEIRTLSNGGRIFTIILIITGVISVSYALTISVELFTSERFLGELRNRRRRRTLQKIDNHCIVCGFGRLGHSLASELRARGTPVVAIDNNHDVVEECQLMGIPSLEGNASDDKILRDAGIERATSLVAATRTDAENVFVVLTAKSIKPDLRVIARCNSNSSIPKMEKAGADTVISPHAIAGQRIAHMLTHPNVTNFLDGVLDFGDHKMRLEEFVISPRSSVAGFALKEAKLTVAVLAVDDPAKPVVSHPNANTKLVPGTAIIVMGLDRELIKMKRLIEGSP